MYNRKWEYCLLSNEESDSGFEVNISIFKTIICFRCSVFYLHVIFTTTIVYYSVTGLRYTKNAAYPQSLSLSRSMVHK
jgi:hypothetical protein